MSPQFPINFSIRRDESFIKEEKNDKELDIEDFMLDASKIETSPVEEPKKSEIKRYSLSPMILNKPQALSLKRFVTLKKSKFKNILETPQSKIFNNFTLK